MDEEFNQELLEEFPPYDNIEELTKEEILGDEIMNYLSCLKDSNYKTRTIAQLKDRARKLKVFRVFNDIYKKIENERLIAEDTQNYDNRLIFPEMNNIVYNTNRYRLDETGAILERIPKLGEVLVCYHPILPIEKYKNLDDGTEKIKIVFYKKNTWEHIIVDKSTISSNQSIIRLADYGVEVTSENAKSLVKYLSEIANLNDDKIAVIPSISRLGWYKNEFIPYSNQYCYVGNATYKDIFEAVHQEGNYEMYYNEMKKLRISNLILRFMMATSCGSPLIELLNINTFIVHLWGKSEIGKTLMLMICASIWGNPRKGKLLTTLNSTEVAFETINNLLNNLPLLIDELQTINNEKINIDDLIYRLTEGKGKDRGNKDGGLRENTKWNNIILLTGEQPITSNNSKEGVKNRVIEIEQNKKIIDDGNSVANLIFENYGFIGKRFVEIIKNRNNLKDEYNNIKKELNQYCKYSKQIEAIAVILLADKILSEEIFHDSAITYEEAKQFFRNDTDEAERYIQLIIDIANSNINNFWESDKKDDEFPKCQLWGKVDKDDNGEIKFYYFIPNILYDNLKKYNINFDGIREKLVSKEYLVRSKDSYTINTKIRGNQHRVFKIKNIYFGEKDTE